MAGPLQSLVVIDASRVMTGAIVGMLLADHGAEVIKVEPHGGAFFAHDLTRKAWDRGKRSVELAYEDAAERETLKALVATADIFIHSLPTAEAQALGLDRETLAREQPGLIVTVLEAYGDDTPFADRPYGESLAAARLGQMVDKASSFRPGPMYPGHPALHYGQAFLAAIGILAAIRARRETGEGQTVRASLMDAMMAQSPMNNWWQEAGLSYIRTADSGAMDRFGHTRLVTGMFECADGLFMQIHTGGPGGFRSAMEVLGFGDRIQQVKGPEMATPLNDEEYRIARVEIFERTKTKPRDEWIRLFQAADVAALPVLEPAEVLLDDQVEFVGQRIDIADPDFGTIRQAAPAVRFNDAQPDLPGPAPAIGADNGALQTLLARAPARVEATGRTVRHPLEGLRVLDFSSFFACGFAGRLMSDLGADVIKVETPEGDQMRPLPDVFDAAQRGKRGIVLNLKSPEGLAAAHKLVESADVVMHNLRPGKADKLGIGYQTLSALNPRLIFTYLPGYGSRGPKALLKSFAPLVSGWTGLLYEGGGEGNPPTRSVFGNEDYNNGFLGAAAVLMALENRARTGRGDYVECPQLHSSLWTTSEHFLDGENRVVYGMRLDKGQTGFSALDRMYRADDGWVCICARDDAGFAALARGIGQPDLPADPRFATPRDRTANDAALQAIVAPFFQGKSAAEAFAALDAAGAPAEIVRETSWVKEVLHEPWAEQTDRVFEDKASIYGHIREFGLFNRLDRTPGIRKGSAPRLGEHTREILGEAGFTPEQIDDLVSRRIAIEHVAPASAAA
ncbi:CaiB/BaiF CoA transferase family protein [Sphingomonas jatrophae]|uniref:Crotonobetainyl-CoA:carnitine CoA-transferase CaiB n=1 Tax=Sphingomonas jatrophae TaxID=1166337 RepID=A0A1I6KCY2_9SPHN|nr:CoA transferase [Sphingomonas jatrophae]SFR89082.1 Crotonobetainyl-CoA:carnitine CoA-transferase CaiB [Sphingomonas jatrophae]